MKLKKFAAMMLAGVMAVSMLAGCAEGGKKEDDNKEPVATGMTAKVIAALDEDTTKNVEFAADSNLEAVLQKAVKNAGSTWTGVNGIVYTDLTSIDPDLGTSNKIANVGLGGDTEAADKKESKAVFVEKVQGVGKNEATIAKELADKIDAREVAQTNGSDVAWADMEVYSPDHEDKDGKTFWYDFDYTAGIAVVEVNDAVTGETSYIVAVTVTRTPTQTYKHA